MRIGGGFRVRLRRERSPDAHAYELLEVDSDDPFLRHFLKVHSEDAKKFYPVIAGQHYKYLLRQMTEIRDGHRRNANPDMVKVIKPYTNEQLVAISAYQSSLKMPGKMCKPKGKK